MAILTNGVAPRTIADFMDSYEKLMPNVKNTVKLFKSGWLVRSILSLFLKLSNQGRL